MRRAAALLAAVVVTAAPALAMHQNGHLPPPGPAKVNFAKDFPALTDTEWGFALGGFGGIAKGVPRTHSPVIFLHGNNVDHVDWYLVRNDFKAAGWTDQELFGLSYNGLGNEGGNTATRDNTDGKAEHAQMGGDGIGRITNNDVNVADVYNFIQAVRAYTGSKTFSLVSHSLGVTLARKTLKVHPELRADLIAFVGIAGGNHGTSLCPPGSETTVYACDEVAAGTPWLEQLNGPGGSDETYPPAKWMTVYDGTGTSDVAFVGPTYAQSPVLKGADNRAYPFTNHNQLRVLAPIVADYRTFIEAAEKNRTAAATAPKPKPVVKGIKNTPLPATGVGSTLAGLGPLLAAAAATRLLRKRSR